MSEVILSPQQTGKTRLTRLRVWSSHAIAAFVLTVFVSLIALSNGTLVGYPGGYDAYGHVTKIRFMLDYWPNVFWGNIWAGGMPFFYWYSPLPYYLASVVAVGTTLSVESSLIALFVISMIAGSSAMYLCTCVLTENDHLASLAAGIAYGSSSILWSYGIIAGTYPRVISNAILAIMLWLLLAYLKSPATSRRARFLEFLCAVVLSLTVVGHTWVALEAAALLIWVAIFSLRSPFQKIKGLFRIVVFSVLLSAYFVIPFATSIANQGYGFFIRPYQPATADPTIPQSTISLINFFGLENPYGTLAVPVAVILGVLSLLLFRRIATRWASGLGPRMTLAFLTFTAGSILYFYLGGASTVLMGNPAFLHIWPVVTVSALLGVCLHGTQDGLRARFAAMHVPIPTLFGVFVVVLLVASTFTLSNPVSVLPSPIKFSNTIRQANVSTFLGYTVAKELLADTTGHNIANFRFGVPTDDVSTWFNSEFPNVPQTRQYEVTSILNKDFLYWFELSAWGGIKSGKSYSGSLYETRFLLDWFAVKWFLIYPPFDVAKFSSDSSFRLVVSSSEGGPSGFIYKASTPIICDTTAPAVLVVGEKASFDILFRSLAYSGYDSRALIPVYGGRYVDELDPIRLRSFSAIVLYGYDFHDRQRAYSILSDYVKNGGGLLVETGLSPESTATDLLEPSPVSKTVGTAFGSLWHFASRNDSSILAGVRLNSFSPAIYGRDIPWGVSASTNESIRSWASVDIWDEGRPLVVTGQYGKGRVAWSGMNLPYHADSYLNEDESRLIGNLIAWVAESAERKATWSDGSVIRTDPQHVRVGFQGTGEGILFKEFYFQGWKAFSLISDNRQEIPIYLAGPGFMYVSSQDVTRSRGILFEYEPTLIVTASYAVSAITLLGLLLNLMFPTFLRRLRRPRPLDKVQAWWERE